jgi:hypothetical protein
VRIGFFGLIQTLIVVDDGMDAKQIRSYEPEARKIKILSSCDSHDPMGLH